MPLTSEQSIIVNSPNECKLVVALPGSGKTATSVSLADSITKDRNSSVLMVTFTKASAEEMRQRIQKTLPPSRHQQVTCATFASTMLKQHKPLLRGRRLILGAELTSYIHRIARKLGVEQDDVPAIEMLIEQIGRTYGYQSRGGVADAVYEELQSMLQQYGRIDLNTVARELIAGLKKGVVNPLQYTHFIVDEFQDTCEQQYHWLLQHKIEGRYFTVVGDDDQSIYGWRGAQGYQNMLNFQRDFNAKAYLLSKCFRCSAHILGAAQKVIEESTERINKPMVSMKGSGKVAFRVYESGYQSPYTKMLTTDCGIGAQDLLEPEHAEKYRFVVDCMLPNPSEWTVLARTNQELDILETALSERGVPCIRVGGKSIFDSVSAIGIIKILSGLVTGNNSTLVEGLGWLGEGEESLYGIHEFRGRFTQIAPLSSWLPITKELHRLNRDWLVQKSDNPEERKITALKDFQNCLSGHLRQSRSNEKYLHLGVLNAIISMAMNIKGTLKGSVQRLTSMGMGSKKIQTYDDEKCVLCTLTSSKGLEWPKVFIINVNSQTLPSKNSKEPADIEEERRLFYVGMTRAEDELVIQYSQSRPSSFLDCFFEKPAKN
tara:strand:- start:1734 stop:3539 length:1806 start_codon:yes stop_codon:yes gene_type:complete